MTNILMTSLDEIKSFRPCTRGWNNILKGENKTESDDVLFPLVDCVESNSIKDVCWLLGNRKVEIQICVRFARMCANSVKELNNYYSSKSADYADYADYAAADCAAAKIQGEKSKQFLIQCINEFNN